MRNRCIELFQRYEGEELQLRLAQATADEWLDLYKYVPFVQPYPSIWRQYQSMDAGERKHFDKDNPGWVTDNEEMKSYAYKKNRALAQMESNKNFLQEQAKLLEKDVPRRDKIRQVLSQYPSTTNRVETSATVDWDS